ncbi:MAG: ABC transporter permease [Azospirillum sp.]|nr:ABC transporter permease [Azospirillum sp.]
MGLNENGRAALIAVVLPALNLAIALVASAGVIVVAGENPVAALGALVRGAFGYPEAIGYTLYYATNFIFAGLAVSVAFQAGQFNIGGEGQATLGGLGAGLAILALGAVPWPVAALAGTAAAAGFGAVWAFLPGWLQARRGSHIVITTIMFNFIAAALMTWLMVDILIDPGQQAPESRIFPATTWLPSLQPALAGLGFDIGNAPLNLSFLLALLSCAAVQVLVWHSRSGYALRTVGQSETAARYGGISPGRTVIAAMMVSGALAGLVGVNEILGVQHRLLLNFTGGCGFVGIAVALMGRNRPVGVVLAALLFGALAQGGSELSFEFPALDRELVVVIQGLVILFAGALENLFRPGLEAWANPPRTAAPAAASGSDHG